MLLCRQEGMEVVRIFSGFPADAPGCSWFPHWAQIWNCKGRSRKKVVYMVQLVVGSAFTHARLTREAVGFGSAT